jgi:hypothetical protein
MRKLEKQLTLSQTEHGKDALARLGIHNPTTQAWMKGYFFHHFKDLMQARAPLKANPHYNAGWWCFEHECSQIVHETGTYLIAAKKHWLSSQFRADQHEVLSGMHAVKTIQLHVQKTRKSVAVIQVLPEAGVYREINRGFVLPNTLSDQAIV